MTFESTTHAMHHHSSPAPIVKCSLPLLALLLVACARLPVVDADASGDLPPATAIHATDTPLPTPPLAPTPNVTPRTGATPAPDTSLTICTGAEPLSLTSPEDASYAAQLVRAAIYDGPIDILAYRLEPVILTKVPSLADGDAVIAPVPVKAGDLVLDASGTPTRLAAGVRVRPAGCRAAGCAVAVGAHDLAVTDAPLMMDQMRVTFELAASGWTWADGTPLTAHDSVRGFDAAPALAPPRTTLAPRTTTAAADSGAGLKLGTSSYHALDDRHVVWVGLPGYLPATYAQAFWTPLAPGRQETGPQHHEEGALDPDQGGTGLPLGYGPYTLAAWHPGRAIYLRRNAGYDGPERAAPGFEEIQVQFWSGACNAQGWTPADAADAVQALQTGTCDLLAPDLDLEQALPQLEALAAAGAAQLIAQPSATWEHLTFNVNTTPPLFADVRARQAVAFCLDREALMREATHGYGAVLDTYLPPEHPLAEPVTPYAYIPDRGATLLNQVGWVDHDGDGVREATAVPGVPDGTPFHVRYLTTTPVFPSSGSAGPSRESTAQQVAAMLGVCGIEVEVVVLPPWEFYAQHGDSPLVAGQFDIAQFAWTTELLPPCDLYVTGAIPTPPPAQELHGTPDATRAVTDTSVIDSPVIHYGWTGANVGGFSDAAYDAACGQAVWSLPGEPDHESTHRQAQRLFAALLPALPLYQDVTFLAARADLAGVIPDPLTVVTWNAEHFE